MIKEALAAISTALRTLLNRRGALALILVSALALIAACYLFVTTREATTLQLLLTLLAAVAAPVIFFLLQAASVNYTRETMGGALTLLSRAARDLPKLILASLPLILLGVALIYGINKLQTKYLDATREARIAEQTARDEALSTRGEYDPSPRATPPPPTDWWGVLFTAAHLLTLGIILPLALIHTWLAVARRGLAATARGFFGVLGEAFRARSVMIYTLGLLVFGLLPYFTIFTRTPVNFAWLELSIFGVRLAIVFTLAVLGWVVTIGALAVAGYNGLAPAINAAPVSSATPPPPSSQAETAHATV